MACIIKHEQDHIEAYDLTRQFIFSADTLFEAYLEAAENGYSIVKRG